MPDSSDFMPLYEFVLEQGANTDAGFIAELRAFHEAFINPDKRRLRTHQFCTVTGIPYPRVRNALSMASYYTKTPSRAIHLLSPSGVRDLTSELARTLATACND